MQKGYVLVRVDEKDSIATTMSSQQGYVPEHRLIVARSWVGRSCRPSTSITLMG